MTLTPTLALGFATIERPQAAQRLIRSARQHLKSIPIYVADQSRDVEAMASFYAACDVQLVRMPYDVGVTTSRNRLAHEIKEDYFVLCDDDFIIGPQTRFDDAVRILEAHADIGVVGGRLYDFDGKDEWTRNWEMYLEYDPLQRILFSIPIYELAPRAREVGGVRFFLCDAVLNFSVLRREMFDRGVAWDERFKSNGEHEDFFLNLKLNSPYRVAYLPTMSAYHHHPEEYRRYRSRLRDRNEGWRRFLEKWNIDQHVEFGLGVKSTDDVSAITDGQTARSRFFVNADLSLRREGPTPDGLLVNLEGGIETIGALDERGEGLGKGRPPLGTLLLDRRSGAIVPAPAEEDATPRLGKAELDRLGLEREQKYRLETSARDQAVSYADGEIDFRYDAVLRTDSDFNVWYYRKSATREGAAAAKRLAVVARWSANDGTVLVWRSRRTFLDLRGANYWRPLLLNAPPAPAWMKWVRFDIITDGGAESEPICTGVVFRTRAHGEDGGPLVQTDGIEALGLSRLVRDGATPGVSGQYLEELERSGKKRLVTISDLDCASDLSLLPLEACDGLEVLYFNNWGCLGRSLVSARLPAGDRQSPRFLALPGEGWRSARARLYGFGRRAGFVTLRAAESASRGGK